MQLIRRECFWLFALATGAPLATQAWAQGGPKLTQILRHDLENQDYTVQETVASIVEFSTGSASALLVETRRMRACACGLRNI